MSESTKDDRLVSVAETDAEEERKLLQHHREAKRAERTDHAMRTMTITGVRLSDPKDPNAPGFVLLFNSIEATAVMKTIVDVVGKRGN